MAVHKSALNLFNFGESVKPWTSVFYTNVENAVLNNGFATNWSTRGSKIFGNGQKQPYLKLCLLKTSHEQVIKSTLFCPLILMWSRDRQFKFDPPGSNFGQKIFQNLPTLHVSCQNTRKPIINQMMFLY